MVELKILLVVCLENLARVLIRICASDRGTGSATAATAAAPCTTRVGPADCGDCDGAVPAATATAATDASAEPPPPATAASRVDAHGSPSVCKQPRTVWRWRSRGGRTRRD